ncbi:hypothetical protein RBWH47_05327 [Rhodopirellula baltica WH47]|uniref:Uncharacterized protein n=1 Tax=Rhodopirellula baltica WH47 TaxID=991778 RepID=F2B0N9_RHOBT|nr:hypothetical protein RBWH47_05327 [Rhodopirellula baltica WH47]
MASVFHGTNQKIAWYHAGGELNTRIQPHCVTYSQHCVTSKSGPIALTAKARPVGRFFHFLGLLTALEDLQPDWGSHRSSAFRSVWIVQDSHQSTRTA